jgi:nitroreductase
MSHTTPEKLIRQLNWRYATKQFDSTRKIPNDLWAALEESLILTPSSFGLQPWKFLVIKDPAVREKLKAVSWGQNQITEGSHLVVFAAKKENTPADVEAYINSIAAVRQQPADSPGLAGLKKVILNYNSSVPNLPWNSKQVYIALGNFMTSAAMLGIDTCPMEGLDPVKYDEILGLTETNLATAVACVAGYRASTDKYGALPKVRFAKEELIQYI